MASKSFAVCDPVAGLCMAQSFHSKVCFCRIRIGYRHVADWHHGVDRCKTGCKAVQWGGEKLQKKPHLLNWHPPGASK